MTVGLRQRILSNKSVKKIAVPQKKTGHLTYLILQNFELSFSAPTDILYLKSGANTDTNMIGPNKY